MAQTRVVNIRRHAFDVYIGRAGHGYDGYFGNPFKDSTKDQNIADFRTFFLDRIERDPVYRKRVLELKGKRLGCFCLEGSGCHGDVLVEWIDAHTALAS